MTHKTGGLRGKLRTLSIVGLVLGMLVTGAVLSLFFLEIEDVVYAQGKLTSEITYDIIGHLDSRVTQLNFEEGDDVESGDVIALLDTTEFDEERIRLEAEIREYEAELEVKIAECEALKVNPLPKELWYAESNLKESTEKSKRTEARMRRSLQLASNNAISKREFEEAEIEHIKVQGEVDRARESLRLVQSGIGERNVEKAERDINLVRAKIEGRKAELEFLKRQLAECRITAPNSGRLVELPCKYTRYVQKGVVAARLSSGGAIRGIAYVDESVVRKVRPGQVVRISSGVFNRLEYGIFYGEVTRIYDTPVQEPSTNMTRYPVELSIDPQGRPLRLGSSAEFAIVTGHEPVIYTILNLTRHDEYDNPEPQTPRRAK